ncbi:4Fe-4S dicluster domain-containing protein [Streptomyces sp. TRM43335]|uniref:4Fe-4S dicluster domain-containing protein n=1 Tax=Streptomyces taklimakanensis TaxID=2569853 RepID=A0A6G2B882_9ACTN|nr:4Fe-4S dicluster domain-containing protein [Streptomyces taklimakanensis]
MTLPPGPVVTAPTSAAPVTVTARCAGCGACLLTCPVHAIRPSGGTLLVRAETCTGCLECVEVCPVDAIEETATPARAGDTVSDARAATPPRTTTPRPLAARAEKLTQETP